MEKDKSRKYKFNFVDAVSIGIIFIILVTGYLAYTNKPKASGQDTLLTVRIEDNINNDVNIIYPEAVKEGEVFFNSNNTPVRVVSVMRTSPQVLDIKLLGKGEILNSEYIFNGQKILIGQKAEVHGNYWARGKILNISYEK